MHLPDAPQAEPRMAPRFTYASGSKPLEGYTIKRGIGRGGFGEVYYAVSDAGKEVALKLIQRNLDVELRGVRQCLNLKHPNLLALYDIRTDAEDDRWVVMEHIAGECLEDVLERHPEGLPVEEALQWMRGVTAGVAYLHDHGIVHRDLKPGNIFRDEGIVKIGDYGLAKFLSCSRRSGQTESVGTVHYMAPEIAKGRYGKEIDTYALGILFYEMLTGKVPFEGESVGEVLMKHLTAEPDLSVLCEPYRTIIGLALAKDPEQRISTAQQLLALLPGGEASNERAVVPATVKAEVVVEEEPIARAVRQQVRQLKSQWEGANLPPLAKVTVLIGGGLLALTSIGLWLPPLVMALLAYGGYLVVRAIVTPSAARPQPAALAAPAVAQPIPPLPSREKRRQSWRRERLAEHPERAVILKSPRQKLTELTGSMLIAALVVFILSLVAMVFRQEAMLPEQFAWLALTGTLGTWLILVPAKVWEGKSGEAALRRFTMLVVGLLLGAMAFSLASFLTVELPFEIQTRSPMQQHRALYDVDGSPKLAAYLAYFGFLLFALPWWRQADPGRAARVSLWRMVPCVGGAWLLNFLWPFPQPWGMIVAATMAVSVQLATPWTPRKARG